MENFDKKIPVCTIHAGKLRRYHHLTVLRQLMWPSLVLSNVKDVFLVIFGFFQSFIKMIVWRPDVVFAKGGYVCLPAGIAAYTLHIPLVIHDSDAHPGLTNRILSRFSIKIATGAPLEYYDYPLSKTRYVGIPISDEFHEFSDSEKLAAKIELGIDSSRPLVVITGGGLGASRINDAIVIKLSKLLKICSVVLISGAGQYDEIRSLTPQDSENFQLHSFVSKGMATLLGAADIVVTRAGATTILELAALAKPTILIPNGKLTGGHQLKNAAVYLDNNAVKIVDENELESNPEIIVSAIREILSDAKESDAMARRFASFSKPNAARDVADMILSCVK